jgi:G3E family GTPase
LTKIACVGGFLGAGKTTLIIEAARDIVARGLKVGVITNDQGSHLVDTAVVRGLGFDAEEILGGCFCCRFSEFVTRAFRLVDQYNVDVILAEAVGSCTDLSSTVYQRLHRYHAAQFTLAPLSVVVEPSRIHEVAGPPVAFAESVAYLFGKQLAEADRIILNKGDLLDEHERVDCIEQIGQLVGEIPVRVVSAKTGAGVRDWVDEILSNQSAGLKELDLDYEVYGQAEASLGWLNATVELASEREFSLGGLGRQLISEIQRVCDSEGHAIANLKLLFVTGEGSNWISVTNAGAPAMWNAEMTLPPSRHASLIINARVSADPGELRCIVEKSFHSLAAEHGVGATVQDMEAFAPLPPKRVVDPV